MQLEQAERVFRYHVSDIWPGRSKVGRGAGFVALVIRVDDLSETACVVDVVVVRAHVDRNCPVVTIERRENNCRISSIDELSGGNALYRLGGTLIKVANMLEQIAALGGTDDPAGR